ncbi:MAG: metallophosphoesterase [Actinobacteria bacterium]|nr:metallophosphoesterase [Actinomycetota bacterium]
MGHIRFVVVSDAHMMPAGASPIAGIDACANLASAVAAIGDLRPSPAFVVHLGDLANIPRLAPHTVSATDAYAAFAATCSPLQVPQYPVVGNHDAPGEMLTACPVPSGASVGAQGVYSFEVGSLHGVVLNSRVPGEVPGWIDASQLAWLRRDLSSRRGGRTVVFVHHPLLPIGIDWVDALRLTNGDALAHTLIEAGGIDRVFAGHVHRHSVGARDGLVVETAPSTRDSFGREPGQLFIDAGQGFLVADMDAGGVTTVAEWI